MAQWIEVKAKYLRQSEDGKAKKVTEPYLVDAMSCAEAEARVLDALFPAEELEVKATAKTKIARVLDGDGDKWYQAKIDFFDIDTETGKQVKSTDTYIIPADDFADAFERLSLLMKDIMVESVITSLAETKIVDVFNHNAREGQ